MKIMLISLFLCAVALALTPASAFAGTHWNYSVIGFSPDGKYVALEQSGMVDGVGLPDCSVELYDLDANTKNDVHPAAPAGTERKMQTCDEAREYARDVLGNYGIDSKRQGTLLTLQPQPDQSVPADSAMRITNMSFATVAAGLPDLVVQSYRATYPGSTLPVSRAAPAPAEAANPTVVEALALWFAAEIDKDNAALSARLHRIDPKAYNAFLAERRAAAGACLASLPSKVQADLEVFLGATDNTAADGALRGLATVAAASPESRACLAVVATKVDGRGILVGGLVAGKNAAGADALLPTRLNPGQIFILRPQPLTAWPGDENTAVTVLDPRQGPWRVKLAHSAASKIETHNASWEQARRIKVKDFVRQQRDGYFLVVDGGGAPLGWIGRQEVAFFHEAWSESAASSALVYTSGAASFAHGTWWSPQGRSEGDRPETPHQDRVRVYDFLALLVGRADPSGASLREPYPDRLDLFKVKSLLRLNPNFVDAARIFELGMEARLDPLAVWGRPDGLGALFVDGGHVGFAAGSATVKSTLKKIYKLP